MKKLVVSVSDQVAELWFGEQLIQSYVISTAKKGLSCEEGSYGTPVGKHQVKEKIGYGAAVGAVFRGRNPSGEVWSPGSSDVAGEDLVLTRILWLDGIEAHNRNTYDRLIYLHGTNQEDLLGQPESHGCVRFRNVDIIEIFDELDIGAEVVIRP